MGKLSNFLGKPKEVEITGQKLVLHPLKVKDMGLFSKQNPTEEEAKEIARQIMKLSIENTTDEEIENLPVEVYMAIMDEINKLNGFKDERLDSIKAKIAQANRK